MAGIQEQVSLWQNVQNCYLTSSRRSGSISPIISQQQDGIPEHYEAPLGRTSSVYSRNSGYSDQFFDAEDIDLSGGEEEDISIDDAESSDDEAGKFTRIPNAIVIHSNKLIR